MSKKKLKLSNTEIALGSEDYYPVSHRFAGLPPPLRFGEGELLLRYAFAGGKGE
jgi:hypothetical protein